MAKNRYNDCQSVSEIDASHVIELTHLAIEHGAGTAEYEAEEYAASLDYYNRREHILEVAGELVAA